MSSPPPCCDAHSSLACLCTRLARAICHHNTFVRRLSLLRSARRGASPELRVRASEVPHRSQRARPTSATRASTQFAAQRCALRSIHAVRGDIPLPLPLPPAELVAVTRRRNTWQRARPCTVCISRARYMSAVLLHMGRPLRRVARTRGFATYPPRSQRTQQ